MNNLIDLKSGNAEKDSKGDLKKEGNSGTGGILGMSRNGSDESAKKAIDGGETLKIGGVEEKVPQVGMNNEKLAAGFSLANQEVAKPLNQSLEDSLKILENVEKQKKVASLSDAVGFDESKDLSGKVEKKNLRGIIGDSKNFDEKLKEEVEYKQKQALRKFQVQKSNINSG